MILLIILSIQNQPRAETNPVKIVFTTAIRLYQVSISPAQGDVCNFSPSCSNFAREALEKHGIFWGTLMATDRLLRCNPSAIYLYDKFYTGIENDKIYDPVENNHIMRLIKKPFDIYIPPPE
ncbi:MAG: membrane protein insertion efficiency factor YidD [candidate division WOR-3 bacterium]|nr:membrane protein insertion efficiency factor YidD [candidate division WOR-3 bacterium]